MISIQKILNIIALICLCAVGFALFSQHHLSMPPCAWCVFQRLVYLVIATMCLLANLFPPIWLKRFFAFLVFLLSIGGVTSAWYQYDVASAMFSCDMTFADLVMAKYTQLDAAVPWLFGIYATCMDARVTLLGIEYSLWSLILFACFAVLALWAVVKQVEIRRDLFH